MNLRLVLGAARVTRSIRRADERKPDAVRPHEGTTLNAFEIACVHADVSPNTWGIRRQAPRMDVFAGGGFDGCLKGKIVGGLRAAMSEDRRAAEATIRAQRGEIERMRTADEHAAGARAEELRRMGGDLKEARGRNERLRGEVAVPRSEAEAAGAAREEGRARGALLEEGAREAAMRAEERSTRRWRS